MKVYDDIKEMLCDELEEVVRKNELTPNSLDIMDTAVDILKDLKTIEAMDQEYGYSGEDGYSNRFYPMYAYENGMPNNSYARGRGANARRDAQGRYYDGRSYEGNGYSGDTKEELKKLMHSAQTDREKEAIRMALDNMSR